MSIRIYALAKDLNVEANVLIDICQQLGINTKAAALTNLTDDDVEKIKAHIGQKPQKPVFIRTTDNEQSGCQKNRRDNRQGGGVTIRLYSLAKELRVEGKTLVDICQHLGIKTKASALTNLTEDDVAKIKAYLAQQSH